MKICSVESCDRQSDLKVGLCHKHYSRYKRYGDPLVVQQIRGDDEKRFWSKVNKDGPTMAHMDTPCWIWTTGVYRFGYGKIKVQGRYLRAHQYSYFLANGHWAKPQCLHKCDIPACVNPDHLYAGTGDDNVADRVARNRTVALKGERAFKAKLNTAQVLEIRRRLDKGEEGTRLSKDFAVTPQSIWAIKHRKSWKHI